MDDPLFNRLVETFKDELESLLLVISNNLDKSDKRDEIARAGRNIKVTASSVGANDLSLIAAHIEKIFSSEISITPEIIQLTSQSVQGMREAFHAFVGKQNSPPKFYDLISQLQQKSHLETKEDLEVKTSAQSEENKVPPPPTTAIKEPDTKFTQQIIEIFKAELDEKLLIITDGLLELEKGKESKQDFSKVFEEIFRAAHNIKGSARGVGVLDVGEIAHHLETLFLALQKKTIEPSSEVFNLCLQAVDAMREAMICFADKKPLPFVLQDLLQRLEHCTKFPSSTQAPSSVMDVKESVVSAPVITPKTSDYESIRVSLANLDRVSSYLEEIQINKIAIEDYYSDLVKLDFKIKNFIRTWEANLQELIDHYEGEIKQSLNKFKDNNAIELKKINSMVNQMNNVMHARIYEFNNVFNTLQDEVRLLRLIPVTTLLNTFPRTVRDLSQNLGKKVNLTINDNDVKIDKLVLDGLKDPLVHIIRNAIDHGIETTEQRKSVGKSESGNINIDVNEEGGQILFKIHDDGAGINFEKIINAAIKKNIVTSTEIQVMSKEDIFDLIFHPGFSTKEIATDISGRGVGLDVVRSNLAKLKGRVNFETEIGKGTTLYLSVPLTLVTEHGLIIKSCSQLFVIVSSSVECVLSLKRDDIIDVEGAQTILLDNQAIPLYAFSDILDLESKNTARTAENQYTKNRLPIVIIGKTRDKVALLVDEIIGEREIVLKSLGEPLNNINCIIGATLLGANEVIFVLNSAQLIEIAKAK